MIWSTPAAFWAALSLLAILALHAIRQHPRRLPTTTLHVWRQLADEMRTSFRIGKLVINVPLVLQLLLAALLVLALAGPLWLSEVGVAKDVVLVVDASASMNARDGNATRFERARQAALEQIDELGTGQRMALVAMGRTPRLVHPFTDSPERLRAAVAALTATDAAASLEHNLAFALALAEEADRRQVVLIGDGAYHGEDAAVTRLNEQVRFIPVGGAAQNVGIVQFAYRPEPPPHEGGELLVTLRSYAAAPRGVTFRAELAGTDLVRHQFAVEPGRPYSLVIPVPPGVAGVAEAALETDDDLPTDDLAFAVIDPAPPMNVLLVGQADPPLNAALQAIPNIEITHWPSIYGDGSTGYDPDYGGYDLVLFNRVEPPSLEQGSLVVIGEASPQGGVQADGWVDELHITDWRSGDELLRWVDPRQLWVSKARRLSAGLGTEVVVSGAEGPVVTRRESGGLRVVTLAFDLRESGFAVPETFPLLMANLVDWARPQFERDGLSAGDTYTWWPGTGPAELRVTGPGGRFWTYPHGAEPVRFDETGRVGIYTFDAGGRLERVAVNLLSAAESQIERNPAVVGALVSGERAGTGEVARSGWWLLVLLGALLLLAEWMFWVRDN